MKAKSLRSYPAGCVWIMETGRSVEPEEAEMAAVDEMAQWVEQYEQEVPGFSESIISISHSLIFHPVRSEFVASVTVWFINPVFIDESLIQS